MSKRISTVITAVAASLLLAASSVAVGGSANASSQGPSTQNVNAIHTTGLDCC